MKRYSLVIAFVLMLAGGVALSFIYNQSPERVVGESLRKLSDARSFMGATTVATFAPERIVLAAGADPNLVLLPIVFVGEVGMNVPTDAKASGNATFELIGNTEEGKTVTFHVVVAPDGTSYVEFENIPEAKTSAKVVEELNGKWYSMPSRGLVALLAKDGEAMPQVETDGKATAEAWARIRESVSSGELFGRPTQQSREVLGAVNVTKYDVPFKSDALVAVARDIKTLVRGRALTDDERDEVEKSMAGRTASLQLWVDRSAKKIMQANLDVRSAAAAEAGQPPKPALLSVLMRFTSWNEPVTVEVPKDSQPFGDLIERLKQK